VLILKYGLKEGGSELQRLLGMGWLESARYFATLDTPRDTMVADVFDDVLRARPEFEEQFRQMTTREQPISHTAILGSSIEEKPSDGALYQMEEEAEMI
ncbi:hypothetical protein PENTCL1PPCAC_1438, partial [Pristionchus entomophagus]